MEKQIRNKLNHWLQNKYSQNQILLKNEVLLQLDDSYSNVRVDVVLIQSKSNVIHAFEIKGYPTNLESAIWQTNSLYANYKWLVLIETETQNINLEKLREKGLGLISFDPKSVIPKFKEVLKPNYVDGNMLKYYPSLFNLWSNR